MRRPRNMRGGTGRNQSNHGWFGGYKVRGMATPTLQVSCELEDKRPMRSAMSQINKVDRVICAAKGSIAAAMIDDELALPVAR